MRPDLSLSAVSALRAKVTRTLEMLDLIRRDLVLIHETLGTPVRKSTAPAENPVAEAPVSNEQHDHADASASRFIAAQKTPERVALLRELWTTPGVSREEILRRLNALPGSPIKASNLWSYVTQWKIAPSSREDVRDRMIAERKVNPSAFAAPPEPSKPEPPPAKPFRFPDPPPAPVIVPAARPPVKTEERIKLLRDLWYTDVTRAEILDRMNALPGSPLTLTMLADVVVRWNISGSSAEEGRQAVIRMRAREREERAARLEQREAPAPIAAPIIPTKPEPAPQPVAAPVLPPPPPAPARSQVADAPSVVPPSDGVAGLTAPLPHEPGTNGVPYSPITRPWPAIQSLALSHGVRLHQLTDLPAYNKMRLQRRLQPLNIPPPPKPAFRSRFL